MIEVAVFIISFIETVDISGGAFSFILTPFHIVSLIYILTLGVISSQSKFRVNKGKILYFFRENLYLYPIILLICLSSAFTNYDPLEQSARKTLVIVWNIFFSIFFTYRNLNNLKTLVLLSIKPIIYLQAIFMIKQYLVSLNLISLPPFLENILPESSLEELDIGALKAGGIFFDANRASITIIALMMIFYILKLEKPRPKKEDLVIVSLSIFEVFLSLSRMGIGIIILAFLYLFFKKVLSTLKGLSKKSNINFLLLLIVVIIFVFVFIVYSLNNYSIVRIFQDMFISSPQRQASTRVHFQLIFDGLEIMLSKIKIFLFGVGWGTEYVYAGEYFTREYRQYANFHSGFIGMGVQSGAISLTLMLIYMLKPIVMKYKLGIVMALLILANIFYSYFIQPSYWILLIIINLKYFDLLSKKSKFTTQGKLIPEHTKA
jgi:hypothetical protein